MKYWYAIFFNYKKCEIIIFKFTKTKKFFFGRGRWEIFVTVVSAVIAIKKENAVLRLDYNPLMFVDLRNFYRLNCGRV